jgi:hypothetical protein
MKENKLEESLTWTGEVRNSYILLVGNPEGKSLHMIPRYAWEDIIKMGYTEAGHEDVYCES